MISTTSRTRSSTIATIATATLVFFSLTGCSLGPRELDCDTRVGEPLLEVKREVAVVLAPTSNFLDFNNVLIESGPKIAELLSQDRTTLTVVLADSTPSIVTKYSVDFSEALLEVDRDQIIDIARGRLTWAVKCASQEVGLGFKVDPEVDFLRAIQVASESFSQSASEKLIFVLGNGIQTSGQFSLVEGIPVDASATDKLVKRLNDEGALGELGGATVFWAGMAQVNSLQPGINRQSVDAIVLLWNQLILGAGGRVGSVAAGNVTDGPPSSGAISVSPVEWLADACVSITVSADRGFSFRGNSAEFLEPKTAEAGAKEVAAEINSSACSGSVTVTGFTASGVKFSLYNKEKEQANQILSRERAQAFADLLKLAGVSVEIKVIGAGKGPIYDWDDAGNLVEKLAEKNRKVIVTQN